MRWSIIAALVPPNGAELNVGELVGDGGLADRAAIGIGDPLPADDAAPAKFVVNAFDIGEEFVAIEGAFGEEDDVGGIVFCRFGQRRSRGQPTRGSPNCLEDDELIDAAHVPRQHTRLPHRDGHIPRGAAVAGRVVGSKEVIIDRFGNAHAQHRIVLLAAELFQTMDGVHRVVPADEEHIADIEALELLQQAREILIPEFVTTASQGGAGSSLEGFDCFGSFLIEVDDVAFQKALNPKPHAQTAFDFRILSAGFDDAAKTGVDDGRGATALTDNRVSPHHGAFLLSRGC